MGEDAADAPGIRNAKGAAGSGERVGGEAAIVVVEFATKKLWGLSHRPGSEFNHIFAVTADEVVLGEMYADSNHTMFANRIVRIATAHLDAFVAPW